MTAFILILFLMLRILPGFAVFWSEWISLPALLLLSGVGSRLPFVLLEWAAIAAGLMLVWSLMRRRFLQLLAWLMLAAAIACIGVWYPLYFQPQPSHAARPAQLAALCESLIHGLNAAPPDLSSLPQLPAKTARFPGWMRLLGISGLCSFFTGEAIVSPELNPVALPFTAVHEEMHLQGIAGEGAANIAAYESCLARGGAFAASAKLWALRYGMGMLHAEDPALYSACLKLINADTWRAFRECGGSYHPLDPSPFVNRLCQALGIGKSAWDYEILAPYLAAGYSG